MRRLNRRRGSIRAAAPAARPGRGTFRRYSALGRRAQYLFGVLVALLNLVSRTYSQASGNCPVTVAYGADLARGGVNSQLPTFNGKVKITNAASQVGSAAALVNMSLPGCA